MSVVEFWLTHPVACARTTIVLGTPDELSDPARRARLLSILSNEEKARLDRLHSDAQRDLFLLAHGLLREALSQHADVEPGQWRFEPGPFGRPEIAAPRSPLRFSLSHTNGLVALAVTWSSDVGIDVEDLSRRCSPGLAERYFSARERRDLQGIPAAEQPLRFLECWTLKEAYIKARGLGLAIPFDAFSFYRDWNAEWRIEFAPQVSDDPQRWKFRSWRIGGVHQAALALAPATDELPRER